MKQAEIDLLSGALLNNAEVSRVKKIILDQSFEQTRVLSNALQLTELQTITVGGEQVDVQVPIDDEEQSELKQMRAFLIMFYDKTPDGTTKVKGGKRGTDFDTTRDKEEIRQEVRRMLTLPPVAEDILESLRRCVKTSNCSDVYFVP